MQRSGWISVALLATLTAATFAEPQPSVKKINENHNSYTLYNYKKATPKKSSAAASGPAIPAANKDYAEMTVTAPRLEAVPQQAPAPNYDPTYAQPPHLTPPPLTPPSPQVIQNVPNYTQTYSPGPSLPAASFQSYTTGPAYYADPYFNGGYAYPGFYNSGGLYNGISVSGYYNNRNGLTVRAGFPGYYNGFNGYYNNGFYNQGGFCGPSYGPTNLTPQRFDPLPGEHPNSIQLPRPR